MSGAQLLAEEEELGVDKLEADLGPGLAEAGLHHLQHRQQAPRQLQLGPHVRGGEVGEAEACTLSSSPTIFLHMLNVIMPWPIKLCIREKHQSL